MKKKEFEICVRGIIQKQDKILLCKRKDRNYYFLPGGHVDFGENAKEALIRELKEELNISLQGVSFVGGMENIFQEDGLKKHEFNLVYSVKTNSARDKSVEDHLDFFFFDIKRFAEEKVLPVALKEQVLKWLKNKKIFWVDQK
ncbi:MAG: NUDIX domain-containing protein [bacterium]